MELPIHLYRAANRPYTDLLIQNFQYTQYGAMNTAYTDLLIQSFKYTLIRSCLYIVMGCQYIPYSALYKAAKTPNMALPIRIIRSFQYTYTELPIHPIQSCQYTLYGAANTPYIDGMTCPVG